MFSELVHFLATNHKNLDQIIMLPNVLQLAGALLTLWLGLGSIISKMNDAREGFWNTVSDKILPQQKEELTEPIKTQKDLWLFAKEKNYLLVGIILIIIGYIAATVSFDFQEFNYYYIALLIALLIGIVLGIVKLVKAKEVFLRVKLTCLTLTLSFLTYISLFLFPLLPDKLKITFAFIGSTALIMLITMFIIKSMLNLEVKKFILKPLREWLRNKINNLSKSFNEIEGVFIKKVFPKYREDINKTVENYMIIKDNTRIAVIKNELKLPIEKYLNEKNLDSGETQIIELTKDIKQGRGIYNVKVLVKTEEKNIEMLFSNTPDLEWRLLDVKPF